MVKSRWNQRESTSSWASTSALDPQVVFEHDITQPRPDHLGRVGRNGLGPKIQPGLISKISDVSVQNQVLHKIETTSSETWRLTTSEPNSKHPNIGTSTLPVCWLCVARHQHRWPERQVSEDKEWVGLHWKLQGKFLKLFLTTACQFVSPFWHLLAPSVSVPILDFSHPTFCGCVSFCATASVLRDVLFITRPSPAKRCFSSVLNRACGASARTNSTKRVARILKRAGSSLEVLYLSVFQWFLTVVDLRHG